jgi:hypothetical protein
MTFEIARYQRLGEWVETAPVRGQSFLVQTGRVGCGVAAPVGEC